MLDTADVLRPCCEPYFSGSDIAYQFLITTIKIKSNFKSMMIQSYSYFWIRRFNLTIKNLTIMASNTISGNRQRKEPPAMRKPAANQGGSPVFCRCWIFVIVFPSRAFRYEKAGFATLLAATPVPRLRVLHLNSKRISALTNFASSAHPWREWLERRANHQFVQNPLNQRSFLPWRGLYRRLFLEENCTSWREVRYFIIDVTQCCVWFLTGVL